MYRSFVTCDDPKGVVECGTIRKSKVASIKVKEKPQNRRDKSSKREGMARSSHSQRRVEEDHPSSCSFQLLEVSRGAEKLNQLIDSWSKGLSYEVSRNQSEGVAKELLKGALDLQDSLTMLGKLQEASDYVSKLKKKQKEKVEKGKCDEVWCERSNSYRFRYNNPRVTADGSSGGEIEELRNAIRDGLSRQNLLRSSSQRRIDSSSCVASSSSSHSIDSLTSQTALQKKGKAPNLIAKLMGLEDIPSKFDVEMHKVRKPQSLPKKVDLQRSTTLEEILETAQCQGLLRGSFAKEHKSYTGFHSRRKSVDDVHPIVLIKPMRVPCFDPEQALGPIVRRNGSIDSKTMLKEMRIKQGLNSELNLKGRRVGEPEEIPKERIIREEGAQDRMKVNLILEETEERTTSQRSEREKVEVEKTEVRRPEHKLESKRREEKEGKKKRRDSSPSKVERSNLAAQKQLKEEITDKKVDKVQKVVTSKSREPVERESLKDKTKLTSTKLKKPGNGFITKEEHASQQRASTRKNNVEDTKNTKIHSFKDQKQKENPARDNSAVKPVPEIVECKVEEKRIDVTCEITSEKKESSFKDEECTSVFRVEEQGSQSQSSICSITSPSCEFGEDIGSSYKAEDEMTVISIDNTSYKAENPLKKLLLNSPKFINLAEDRFHLNHSYSKISPPSETYNEVETEAKISSDYAEEYIERRSLWDSQTRHPMLFCLGSPRIRLSIDQLVEEIRCGIEALESYRKDSVEEVVGDGLYGVLERDMMCSGLVSGVWDLGWRNALSVDDIDQTVKDLVMLLVTELIEEQVFS